MSNDNVLSENRKARFNYHFDETYEAGIELKGTEVKSCRLGKVNLADAYAVFRGRDLVLQQAHISEYTHGNRENHSPTRTRRLLMHRHELNKIMGRLQTGEVLIPLKMYVKKRHIKVLLGLGKGKKAHDKRHDIKKKEAAREMQREIRVRH